MSNCLNCGYATWLKRVDGALHPSGFGNCTWKPPIVELPKAFWYLNGPGNPMGGQLERHRPHYDCPQWKAKGR